jgi:hypothetical protein
MASVECESCKCEVKTMSARPGPSEFQRRNAAGLRAMAEAALRYWEEAPEHSTASKRVQIVMGILPSALAGPDAEVIKAARRLAAAAYPGLRAGKPWVTEPLRALVNGMLSALNKLDRSPSAQRILDLCDELRQLWAALGNPPDGSPMHLRALAGLMVLEDSVSAIEGYRAAKRFGSVDEAYLAKYGLLQAMQLAFDSMQAVAGALGLKLRPDRLPGGKVVLVTRNLVAGHPVGGTYRGSPHQHFHDRASVHDPGVIKVMSFQRDDPQEWSGQTQPTADLIANAYTVVTEGLERACDHLRAAHAKDAHAPVPADEATRASDLVTHD